MKYSRCRLDISRKDQINFMLQIKNVSKTNSEILAKYCGVSGRSLRDWARGKYKIPLESAQLLSKKFNVNLPKRMNILCEYWHIPQIAKLGGLARYKIYGPPGTVESRRKGGLISQRRRLENPEKYKKLGCKVKKQFVNLEYSEKLAELVGIIMGDGSITNDQIRIYLDGKVDKDYSIFVSNLITGIFNEEPTVIERKTRGTIEITLSGIMLVKSIEKIGLIRGNKIHNQISFPIWVWKKRSYQIACIRGLFDTDGGLYLHFHKKWRNKKPYLGWCFSNNAESIIDDYLKSLMNIGIRAKKGKRNRIYIYNFYNIDKYMKLVNTSNVKIKNIFDDYLSKYAKR